MTLYESWITSAYDKNGQTIKGVWDIYLPSEQKIYEKMIENKDPVIKGTVSELGERYNMRAEFVCGFLDGIKDALNNGSELKIEELTEETEIDSLVDFETLYKKMVEYKAEHLYSLPQWSAIYTEDDRKKLYTEQKQSTTIRRESVKIGRNDPCPCGSGKKYKKCCGGGAA